MLGHNGDWDTAHDAVFIAIDGYVSPLGPSDIMENGPMLNW